MKQRNIVLGFIGACAACCAIPLAAPLFGSAAFSAALIGFGETAERGFAFVAAGLLSFLAWRNWRSRRALMATPTGACGCAAQEFAARGAPTIACTPTSSKACNAHSTATRKEAVGFD
jgi:phosphotransferase system  glucose/maltose/N-acetylglucosamine-specific IIC component